MVKKTVLMLSLLSIASLHAADRATIPFETPNDSSIAQAMVTPQPLPLDYHDPLANNYLHELIQQDISYQRPTFIAYTQPTEPTEQLSSYFYCSTPFVDHYLNEDGSLKTTEHPVSKTPTACIHLYALLRTHKESEIRFGYLFNNQELAPPSPLQDLLAAFTAKDKIAVRENLYKVGTMDILSSSSRKEAFFLTATTFIPEAEKRCIELSSKLCYQLGLLYAQQDPKDAYLKSLFDNAAPHVPEAFVHLGLYYETRGDQSPSSTSPEFNRAQRAYQTAQELGVASASQQLEVLQKKLRKLKKSEEKQAERKFRQLQEKEIDKLRADIGILSKEIKQITIKHRHLQGRVIDQGVRITDLEVQAAIDTHQILCLRKKNKRLKKENTQLNQVKNEILNQCAAIISEEDEGRLATIRSLQQQLAAARKAKTFDSEEK